MSTAETRLQALQWLDAADKLLEARDLHASRNFAKKAKETDPQIDGADQIITIIDVLLASEKRINRIHLDWYAVLQFERRDVELERIKRQYKKLALLLHPDKNKFPLADIAFKLICDASNCLLDSHKRSVYDTDTASFFVKYDPVVLNKSRQPPQPRRKSAVNVKAAAAAAAAAKAAAAAAVEESGVSTFWTLCPYCYYLYEYPRAYEDCCLRCQNCRRAFHGVVVPSPPPPVTKDFYHCTWAFFPIGCAFDSDLVKNSSRKPFAPNAMKRKEPSESGVEEKIDPEWVGMDLNLEVSDTEEFGKTDAAGVEIQGLDKEATEGSGFFEDLEKLLGNIVP